MAEPDTGLATAEGEKGRELPEQWLDLARAGQETVAETFAGFIDTVERVVPVSAGAAERRRLVNSGLGMAQAVARAPYDAARSVVHSVVLVNVEVDVDVASREPTSQLRSPAG